MGQSASKGGKSIGGMDSDDGEGDDYGREGEDDEDYDAGIMGDLPSHPAMKKELI